jgi:trigger factor
MVEFKVKINEVYDRQLPELDEEFVKNFGLKSVDELKTNIKKSLLTDKKQREQNKCERELLDKLIEKSKFGDIPESLLDHESKVMISEFEYGIESQGGKFDDYLSHIGKTREQFVLELLPEAMKRVKSSMAIRKISEVEKIEVTKEEIDKAVADLIKQFGGKEKNLEEKVNNPAYREYLANSLSSRKVIAEK